MLILSILFFLVLSALFSGTEIAFVSASKLSIELKKKTENRRSRILASFYDKPGRFISTMLVGNNIALVFFTILMAQLLGLLIPIEHDFSELIIYTLITTIVILILGEYLPKTFFQHYADRIIYWLAIPLKFLSVLLFLPSMAMSKLTNFILKYVFRTPLSQEDAVITRVDLGEFIKSRQNNGDDELNTDIFEKALYLEDQKVRECMVPRTEIMDIDETANIEELLQVFKESNLSRILVTKDDIDEVLGYVHHQQLLQHPQSIKEIVIDIPFVPEVMRVRDLLNMFIKNRLSIVCVVDEYGGTAGIVTMEDILEEIFGEIEDEHDQEEHIETQISDKEYIFSGRLELDYLTDKYDLSFPEGDYQTLSGYLVMTTETIPEKDTEIVLNGYKFILELVSDTKIETVRLIVLDQDDEKED